MSHAKVGPFVMFSYIKTKGKRKRKEKKTPIGLIVFLLKIQTSIWRSSKKFKMAFILESS